MSFYLRKGTKHIKADVSWGDYVKSTEKYTTEKGEEKTRYLYTRQPMKETVDIDFESFEKRQYSSLPVDSNLHL